MAVNPRVRADYLRQVRSSMTASASVDLVALMKNAIAEQERAVGGMFETVAKTFGDLQASRPDLFQDAHQKVGDAAMRSVRQAFTQRRYRRPTGRYRANQNRLPGALARALRHRSHVRATPRTLELVNQTVLDKEAAHWRRLNFGAGRGSEGGITAPEQFPIEWAGITVGVLGLDMQPSPAFTIPRGYWIGPGGERVSPNGARLGLDQFFLSGRRPTETRPGRPSMVTGMGFRGRPQGPPGRGTRGIASSNFLDAGVRRVANELPRAYETLYSDLYRRSRGDLQAVARSHGTRVVRPSTQRIRYHWR